MNTQYNILEVFNGIRDDIEKTQEKLKMMSSIFGVAACSVYLHDKKLGQKMFHDVCIVNSGRPKEMAKILKKYAIKRQTRASVKGEA